MYHHIGKPDDDIQSNYFVDVETFSRQLDMISASCHPLTLAALEECYLLKKPLPERPVLLTFDDGYKNNYTYAYPLAQAKKVPFTVFVSTGEIGRNEYMLTWAQIKEMRDSGWVSFASHGVNHQALRKLTDEDISRELLDSKAALEQQLGLQVRSFCYPYGAFDGRVRSLVLKSGYTIDFGTRKGINSWPWNGACPLRRAHIMRSDDIEDFRRQLHTGYKKGFITWFI